MQEKLKNKKATKSSENKQRRQQAASKRKTDAAATRSPRENKMVARSQKNDNPRVPAANPRRPIRKSRAYGYFVAALFIILGAVLFLMLFTFTSGDLAEDSESALNLFGIVGAYIANVMLTLFGLASFWFSATCMYMGVCTMCGRQFEVKPSEMIGVIILLLGSSPLLHLAMDGSPVLEHAPGGVWGQWLAEMSVGLMPTWGGVCIGIVASLFGILLVTDTSLKTFCMGVWRVLKWCGKTLGGALSEPFKNREPAKKHVAVPEPIAVPKEEEYETPEVDISDSLYYEDSTSQLLDGLAADLEERQAQARQSELANVQDEMSSAQADDEEKDEVAQAVESESTEDQSEEISVCLDESIGMTEAVDDEDLEDTSSHDDDEVDEADEEPMETVVDSDQRPEKAEKTDGLVGIMARIRRSASPKPRSIKRSHSVPALEPEFDFGSILPPEQIGTTRSLSSGAQTEAMSNSVLGGWKPRSIGKKSSESHESLASSERADASPVLAHSNATPTAVVNDVARRALQIPAPELPTHMTKDLLVQLATEEIELSDRPVTAVTKVGDAGRLIDAYADTEDFKDSIRAVGNADAPKRLVGWMQKDKETAEHQGIKLAPVSSNVTKPGQKATVPASVELQALMEENGFGKESKAAADMTARALTRQPITVQGHDALLLAAEKQENAQRPNLTPAVCSASGQTGMDGNHQETRDGFDAVAVQNSTRSGHVAGSFVVAEEKKRVSEDELLEADRKRAQKDAGTHTYQRPPLSLLHYDPSTQKGFDAESLRLYADKIEAKLAEYNVQGTVVSICPGPIITRFEYQPAPGTKVSKISGLSDDLMMALEITSIRILAPIPGKNVVGIEIPNERRNTIYLKEIIGSRQFEEAKSILTIALGKDSEGEPVVSDLAKMPHLLVAGSTGSGKSVGINTMLCSLLYNATPDEVKLILVDPKCLELSIYEGIPHLLVPPITTAKETAAALDWACEEMDERYRLLASFGVRNIAGYNEQLKNPTLPRSREKVAEKDENGEPRYKHMPYIVIVVDEFADLMMVSGKEIETSIARLAQKARAAGIHIILATQRPSTNVITGVIKANFPTRLAFRVFSVVDSRTILDSKGAEALLGMGDSLFLPPNTGILQRVHGAYVSDDEVQSVVSFLSSQRAPEYNLDITTPKEDASFEDEPAATRSSKDVKFDELYDQALDVVLSSGQPTASYLQRRLDIGFNRAARILEQLEREGVVSAPMGPKKKREILIGKI